MRLIYFAIFSLIVVVAGYGVWSIYGAPKEMTTLTVSAGPRGSDSYVLMEEISEVMERHSDTVRLRVFASQNSSISVSRLHNGVVDLATVEENTPAYADVRLVSRLYPDDFLFITRDTSPIFRIDQILGKRIAIPEDGSSRNQAFWSVIDHYRLPPRGFSTLPVNKKLAVEAFIRGEVDALFVVNSIRDPFLVHFLEELRQRNIAIRFLPIDQAQAMALKRPFLKPIEIVRGAFDGSGPVPRVPVKTASIDRLLVARTNADPEAVAELVRVIFENRLDLLIRLPLSASIRGPDQNGTATLSYHVGAQSYYDRDKPHFLQENAEPIALGVTVFAMLLSALLALRRSLGAVAKNRADVYNIKLLEIAQDAASTDDIEQLGQLRAQMAEIFEKVVHALDKDQVTEESFRSFSFIYSIVTEQINTRQNELES